MKKVRHYGNRAVTCSMTPLYVRLPLANWSRHKKTLTPFHIPQTSCSNRSAALILNGQVLEGLGNIRRLQGFEHILNSFRFFRPMLPGSIFARIATKRCSFRAAFFAGFFWVCVLALTNRDEFAFTKTRGFTSCSHPLKLQKTGCIEQCVETSG